MAAMITALQTLVSRNLGALEPAVLSICRVRAGEANNVIPASAHLEGTLRTFDDAVATRAVARIEIREGVARAHDLTAEVRLHGLYPALHNHAQCADAVRDAASDIEGLDYQRRRPPPRRRGRFRPFRAARARRVFFSGRETGPTARLSPS